MTPQQALDAIASPVRRDLLRLVWEQERSSGELAELVGLTRPATSQHLRVLRDADLVEARVEGTHRWYRARIETIAELQSFLDGFWGDRLAGLRSAAEGKE